jgi:hypothetical protein
MDYIDGQPQHVPGDFVRATPNQRPPMLQIRRVKMDDRPNRQDKMWVLFWHADIAHPLAMLSEYELETLLKSIRAQKKAEA